MINWAPLLQNLSIPFHSSFPWYSFFLTLRTPDWTFEWNCKAECSVWFPQWLNWCFGVNQCWITSFVIRTLPAHWEMACCCKRFYCRTWCFPRCLQRMYGPFSTCFWRIDCKCCYSSHSIFRSTCKQGLLKALNVHPLTSYRTSLDAVDFVWYLWPV